MLGRRLVLVAAALALAAGPGLAGAPVSTAATAATAAAAATAATAQNVCPPAWLGTTTNAEPRISDDGRFAVFSVLPPGSAGAGGVIVLRDLRGNRTTTVSAPFREGWDDSDFLPDISGDGNRISYERSAPDVYDNNAEIWVQDRRTGARTLEGAGMVNTRPDLSENGRYLTFARQRSGGSGYNDIYVRDVDRDVTTLVSANPAGEPANHTSDGPRISANGRYVLFWSEASDLTSGRRNQSGLFIRDVRIGHTTAIPHRGLLSAAFPVTYDLSPDGRFVVYTDSAGVWRYDRRARRTASASKPSTARYQAAAESVGTGGRWVLLRTWVPRAGLAVRNIRTGHQIVLPADSYPGEITPDARYAVFYTSTRNLDPHDTAPADSVSVYVRDLSRGTTELVSSVHAGGNCA